MPGLFAGPSVRLVGGGAGRYALRNRRAVGAHSALAGALTGRRYGLCVSQSARHADQVIGVLMKMLTLLWLFLALLPAASGMGVAAELAASTPPLGAAAAPSTPIELFVNEPWLAAIRQGKKTVAGRAVPRQEFAAWIGRVAKFYSAKQALRVRIAAVHHDATLREVLATEGWQNAAPHLSSLPETEKAYLPFYSGNYIRGHGGMNGLMISLQP